MNIIPYHDGTYTKLYEVGDRVRLVEKDSYNYRWTPEAIGSIGIIREERSQEVQFLSLGCNSILVGDGPNFLHGLWNRNILLTGKK